MVDASVWQFATGELAQEVGACSAFGVSRQRCTWRLWMNKRRKLRPSAWIAPIVLIRRVGKHHPPAISIGACHPTICSDCRRKAYPIHARGSIIIIGVCASHWEIASTTLSQASPYCFLPAEGDGLHQIAVGPVHAGIIEPGHFRFTASGEAVVRLEQRLGYTHKGI